MKTEEVTAEQYRTALAAAPRGRAPRLKRQPPAALPYPATMGGTDWTQGKADKVLAKGFQISYDTTQRCWAWRGDERRGPYETVTALLEALEGGQ